MASCSSQLVAIRTSWEDAAFLGARGRRQLEGPGIILVSDGHRALVLASRRLVDPPYDTQGPRSVNNVAFQVFRPGQGTTGEFLYGRLVAVYMNSADLALLRIDAPSPQRLITAMAQPSQLRTGETVTLVGRPSDKGFLLSTALVNNLWPDGRLAGQQLQLSISTGPVDTLGIVLCQGGKLVGLLHNRQGSVVMANSTGQVGKPDYWEYLMDEGPTRELLELVR